MKKHILFILSLILMLSASSCILKKKDKTVDDYLKNLNSYKAEVEVEIFSNKGTSQYRLIQFFKNPDKLRVETLEPDFLKGKVMVLKDGKFQIFHPLINQKYEGDCEKEDTLIHLGIIQSSIVNSKEYETSHCILDETECIKLRTKIEGDNIYKHEGVVYFTKQDIKPLYFEIYDNSGTLRYRAKYINFEYNKEISDDVFTIR